MFRYLVEKHGFTVFALEASMPDCLAMDDYVLNGTGNPKEAVGLQGFWTWNTQEVLDLIIWMRKYNLDPKHKQKLRVVGFDMQSQVSSTLYFERKEKKLKGEADSGFWEGISWDPLEDLQREEARKRLDGLVDEIAKKQGEEQGRIAKMVEHVFFQSESNTWINRVTAIQRQVIPTMQETFKDAAKLIEELKPAEGSALDGLKFIDEHKKAEAALRMSRQAAALTQLASNSPAAVRERLSKQAELLNFLAMTNKFPISIGKTFMDRNSFRDKCMAENIVKISTDLFPNQKIFAWAHNGHVMRHETTDINRTMGAFLNNLIGKNYYPLGFSFASGIFNAKNTKGELIVHDSGEPEKDSLDASFNDLKRPLFFLPLTKDLGEKKSRSIGALYNPAMANRYYMSFDPAKAFSGLIYVQKSTPSKLLK
jgi:erythromycin esterase-like protein